MKAGDEFGPFLLTVTREQLVRYAGASDDYNPIHYDDEAARAFGLPGVIVHGMLNMGLMARLVAENLAEAASVEKFSVRFRQMVQPGREVGVSARVRSVEAGRAELDVQLGEPSQKPAVSGKMTVRLKGV